VAQADVHEGWRWSRRFPRGAAISTSTEHRHEGAGKTLSDPGAALPKAATRPPHLRQAIWIRLIAAIDANRMRRNKTSDRARGTRGMDSSCGDAGGTRTVSRPPAQVATLTAWAPRWRPRAFVHGVCLSFSVERPQGLARLWKLLLIGRDVIEMALNQFCCCPPERTAHRPRPRSHGSDLVLVGLEIGERCSNMANEPHAPNRTFRVLYAQFQMPPTAEPGTWKLIDPPIECVRWPARTMAHLGFPERHSQRRNHGIDISGYLMPLARPIILRNPIRRERPAQVLSCMSAR
jgi:hypothetical protein